MDEVERNLEINTNQVQEKPQEQEGVHARFDEKMHGFQQELNRRTQLHEQYRNDRRSNGQDDSPQMHAIKEHLRTVNNKLMEPMEADQEAYTEQVRDLRREYDALIASCDDYIGSHFAWLWGEAKRRKNLVKRIKQSAKEEKNQLRDLQGNWQYHRDRSEGMLVGHALGHAVRDYKAYKNQIKPVLESITFSYQPEGQDYEEWYGRTKKKPFEFHFLPQAKTKDWRIMDAVSAYRFADYMGVTNTVQAVALVMGKDRNNKIHYGKQVMFPYRNQFTLRQIMKKQDPKNLKLVYSTRAIRMLSQIKLFSLLMGRVAVDETEDILLNVYETENVDGKTVLHIDGAMLKEGAAKSAWVKKTFTEEDENGEEQVKKRDVRLKPGHAFVESEDPEIIGQQINTLRLEFGIDDTLSDTIKVMDEEDIRYVMGDIISKNEIRVLNQRLQYIKGELSKHTTVRSNRRKNAEQQDEDLWNTDKNRDVLQRRLSRREDNPVMTFGKLFQGHEIEIERQLTEEELAERKEQKRIAEEERKRVQEKVDAVRKEMASLKKRFKKDFGSVEKMDAEMKNWKEICQDDEINQQTLSEQCQKKLIHLDQFIKQTKKLHDKNQDISAEELDKDKEISEMYAFMKEMEKNDTRYMKMIYQTFVPAYADRVEKLCVQVTKKFDVDRILEDTAAEKQKAFLSEWKKAKKKKDYQEKEWRDKEKTFIGSLSKLFEEVKKVRKDPSVAEMAFNCDPKKMKKPAHAKVYQANHQYFDYLRLRKERVGI